MEDHRHKEPLAAAPPLSAEEDLWHEMLAGYVANRKAAGRDPDGIARFVRDLRNFAQWVGTYPWDWTTADVDQWSAAMVDEGLAKATIRKRQGIVRRFCEYLTNPLYNWHAECSERFGKSVSQVCHDWNTTRHVDDLESSPEERPFTRREIAKLFDHCDDRVETLLSSNHKGALAAWRYAVMKKVQYGGGLRANEVACIGLGDLLPHPAAPQFGRCAVIRVRYGKRPRGGGYRVRGVQMTMDWVVEALQQYIEVVLPLFPPGPWLFPSERTDKKGRQQHVSPETYSMEFGRRCAEVELDPVLSTHNLRHSYLTLTAELGRDPVWRQKQAGHKLLATTSIYTHVSGQHMNGEMSAAIDQLTTRKRDVAQ